VSPGAGLAIVSRERRYSVDEQLAEALGRIPVFEGVDPESARPERLGGLTNRNYRVSANGESYVLRIPGAGTSEYIDRAVEEHNARAAAAAGVNAEVVFFDAADGLMLTRYLECETLSPAAFTTKPGVPARVAATLRRMHASGREFRFRFELFAMIGQYLDVLEQKAAELPDGYHEVVEEAGAVREALEARPVELAPCHNDPLTENFLDDGGRVWLVDWEYSGMNDPYWDLGDVSVEAGLSAEQELELLNAYTARAATEADLGRMTVYKAMADLLWTLWGLIQHANDNPTDDYWAYSTRRFERCKALMGAPKFREHLQAVRSGRLSGASP
jgi:thiamine kinase-like enzyme